MNKEYKAGRTPPRPRLNRYSRDLTPEQELVIKDLYWRISKKYTVAFNYRECEIELAAISIASYYCNDVFGKDVCNLFLKDENTFSLG